MPGSLSIAWKWPPRLRQAAAPSTIEERGRRRGAAAADHPLRQDRRPALRRHLGLHQEHARLGSGRVALLAPPDAQRRRGPRVHRPADDRVRFRGCRAWPTPGRCRSRWRGQRRSGLRRSAGGLLQPHPGVHLPRHCAQIELGGQGDRLPPTKRSSGQLTEGAPAPALDRSQGIQVSARRRWWGGGPDLLARGGSTTGPLSPAAAGFEARSWPNARPAPTRSSARTAMKRAAGSAPPRRLVRLRPLRRRL